MAIEAMKQALEFIDSVKVHPTQIATRDALHTALRAAIEQAEKPVAWYVRFDTGRVKLLSAPVSSFRRAMWESAGKSFTVTPLYTAPRQWIGLTDEEIMQTVGQITNYRGEYGVAVGHAIEAKLKEKNDVLRSV